MDFYDDMQQTAIDMVTEFGTDVTYTPRSASGGDYDIAIGIATPIVVESVLRKCLITDQAGNRLNFRDGQTLQDGSLIQSGDKWIYLVPDAAPPALQDQIEILGLGYSIKDVQVYGPGGIDLLYLCVVRR